MPQQWSLQISRDCSLAFHSWWSFARFIADSPQFLKVKISVTSCASCARVSGVSLRSYRGPQAFSDPRLAIQPSLNLALGRVYLTAHDPEIPTRTWASVMASYERYRSGKLPTKAVHTVVHTDAISKREIQLKPAK